MRKSLIGCATDASELCLENPPTHGTGLAVHGNWALCLTAMWGNSPVLKMQTWTQLNSSAERAKEKHDILITIGDISRNVHKGET